jgi:hypothetical protein
LWRRPGPKLGCGAKERRRRRRRRRRRVKVKLSLGLTKYHTMKTFGVVQVQLH